MVEIVAKDDNKSNNKNYNRKRQQKRRQKNDEKIDNIKMIIRNENIKTDIKNMTKIMRKR